MLTLAIIRSQAVGISTMHLLAFQLAQGLKQANRAASICAVPAPLRCLLSLSIGLGQYFCRSCCRARIS